MRQTKGENRNSGFQAVVCARQMERGEIMSFKLWCAPDKVREQKECVSEFGVRQTKGENRNRGFRLWCAADKEREEE